jgi:hypothetical protein
MKSPAAGHGTEFDAAPAGEGAPPIRSPLKFFLLVFALSAAFWLAGGMTDPQLMPGLSASALMAFCPLAVALLLVHRYGRGAPSTLGASERSSGTSPSSSCWPASTWQSTG